MHLYFDLCSLHSYFSGILTRCKLFEHDLMPLTPGVSKTQLLRSVPSKHLPFVKAKPQPKFSVALESTSSASTSSLVLLYNFNKITRNIILTYFYFNLKINKLV